MKPLPDPWRGPSKSRWGSSSSPRRWRESRLVFDVPSTFTTAGLMRSATSAKFTTPGKAAGRAAGFASPDAAGGFSGAEDTTAAGVSPPATMTPIRKATADDRAIVRSVKRRMAAT